MNAISRTGTSPRHSESKHASGKKSDQESEPVALAETKQIPELTVSRQPLLNRPASASFKSMGSSIRYLPGKRLTLPPDEITQMLVPVNAEPERQLLVPALFGMIYGFFSLPLIIVALLELLITNAMAGLILLGVAVLLLLAGFFFCMYALIKNFNAQEQYSGLWMAVAGLVFCTLTLLVFGALFFV